MVVDTTYYDLLNIEVTATSLEIKKAYRKQAIRLHPDKNPDDPTAAAKFQEVGQAYQVLSDDNLRSKYDKYGIQESIPKEGFEDPAEFFSMIFGGEAFKDWIGELSLISEITKSAELSEEKPDDKGKDQKTEEASSKSTYEYKSTDPINKDQKFLSHQSHDEATYKEVEEKKRKEELEKFEEECRLKKIETRNKLAKTLIEKLSLVTETDMKDDVIESFKSKIRYEAESLKMESFGLDILHTIGLVYKSKSKIFLKNQTFFGWGGLWWSVKEKGGVVKDTFRTVSAALDAQRTMEEYAKMQQDNEYHLKKEADEAKAKADEEKNKLEEELEKLQKQKNKVEEESQLEKLQKQKNKVEEESQEQGTESTINESNKIDKADKDVVEPTKHTAEDLAEMEQYLLAKVLAAAWNGSKFEIQGTLRAVCDQVLEDEEITNEQRIARAKALRLIGEIFVSVTRTEAEDEEAKVFEALVAEASTKREKKKKGHAKGESAV
ncbi:DJP1 [Candida pseudojiufengensis]|uniref:DJP1 n=1 Tax=Candida pseudojiufengensis TaxID=497109 RepID=UPI00222525C2|nr:DJP1 [Candida pseudojiufengensis]KAI5963585.1 DJP1 [Candida pseudojiufengensis]